ncbi:MAG: HEAT repeat domain-containing protein [Archangium sp.]|nr:HEAT repeat domain-containing protein [Archangium sp.]
MADPRLRASACGACLTSPDQGAAWLSRLPALPPRLLEDQDWEVRWAALLFEAKKVKGTAAHQLASWLARAQGGEEEVQRACLTAVHAAGALKTPMAALLAADPVAAKTCAAREKALRDALWLELYAESAPTRREALTHLARAFDRTPARVLLDALPSHAAAFDELVLDTLASWSLEAELSPAASLLSTATPADVAAMNRVLAVYARRLDAARPLLASPDEMIRRQGLGQLMELAPLSERELLGALADAVPGLRLHAARGLARGESRSLAAMAEGRLSGEKPATRAQQLVLLELVGDRHEPDCAATVLKTWRDQARAPELRRRALAVAASCSWKDSLADVEAAFGAAGELERASAIAALGHAPRTEQLTERLTRATDAVEPSLRVAACQAIAQQRWRGGTARLDALAADAVPEVRSEAVRGLVALDAPGLEARLGTLLEKDASPVVRATAAGLLSRFTSPRTVSALSQAARNDTDSNVKLVAAQSLRKLVPGSLPP